MREDITTGSNSSDIIQCDLDPFDCPKQNDEALLRVPAWGWALLVHHEDVAARSLDDLSEHGAACADDTPDRLLWDGDIVPHLNCRRGRRAPMGRAVRVDTQEYGREHQ